MQRIWITGSSASGKTTLANMLGKKLSIPVYHRDRITWGENWQERSECEQIELIKSITGKDKWIFEGNMFTASKKDGRFDRCDTIIYPDVNRFLCLYKSLRRYFKYRKIARPDLADGCSEEYSVEHAKYILFGYPKKSSERQRLFSEAKGVGKTVIILNGCKGVKKWLDTV